MAIIEVEQLCKKYGSTVAVDNVSFEVSQGEIFGMVGPNGAGKTTVTECIEGLRKPDSGKIRIFGSDLQEHKYSMRERIGMQLQEGELQDRIKVKEAIKLFASFYEHPVRLEELLDEFDLVGSRNNYFVNLSGGQKKRVLIALALVGNPDIIFLDELTSGLDPQGRRVMWDLVKKTRQKGKTVFLTTHYMEDAERLCDRVLIMDHGRIVALDRPENLVRSLGSEKKAIFTVDSAFQPEPFKTLSSVTRLEQIGERVIVYGQGEDLLGDVVRTAEKSGCRLRDLRFEQPTLEDVFLALTGREMHD